MTTASHLSGVSGPRLDERPMPPREALRRLLRATVATALLDFIFASGLASLAYGSTVARVWQGVASTIVGPAAVDGGAATVALGLAMHVGVALAWSAVFLVLVRWSPWLRRAIAAPSGAIAVAFAYGALVWLVMSLVVIPLLVHRPPTIGARWWVQLAGHAVSVGLPIVWGIRGGRPDGQNVRR